MPGVGWRLQRVAGVGLIRCDALSELPGLGHAFSTREGPGGPFDLGGHDATEAAVLDRRACLTRVAGIAGPATVLHQVHGDSILRASRAALAPKPPRADGLVALLGDGPASAAVRWADCLPVLLADREGTAVAAVHAGWRGTACGIARRAVERLRAEGVASGALVAALGPAIGPCCYTVGPEVVDALSGPGLERWTVRRDGGLRVDLAAANRAQLEQEGVPPGSIHAAPWCTSCHEELFFSHRREGARAGRQMACIGWNGASA